MTDEEIKEEFEKFMNNGIPIDVVETARNLSDPYGLTGEPLLATVAYSQGLGFISGFRSAERLAKIEVLEEMLGLIDTVYPKQEIISMLSALKVGQ